MEQIDDPLIPLPETDQPPLDKLAIWKAEYTLKLEAQRQLLIGQGHKETWTTDELEHDFKVETFGGYMCWVTRKSDGVRGSLDFTHSPRVYFDFVPR